METVRVIQRAKELVRDGLLREEVAYSLAGASRRHSLFFGVKRPLADNTTADARLRAPQRRHAPYTSAAVISGAEGSAAIRVGPRTVGSVPKDDGPDARAVHSLTTIERLEGAAAARTAVLRDSRRVDDEALRCRRRAVDGQLYESARGWWAAVACGGGRAVWLMGSCSNLQCRGDAVSGGRRGSGVRRRSRATCGHGDGISGGDAVGRGAGSSLGTIISWQ